MVLAQTVQQVALDHSIFEVLNDFWFILIIFHPYLAIIDLLAELWHAEELVLSRAEDETEILRSQNKELKEVAKISESKRWIEVTWIPSRSLDAWWCLIQFCMIFDIG